MQHSITRQTFMVNLIVGCLLAVINICYGSSFAALIFSGELVTFVPKGLGLVLIGFIINNLVYGLKSTVPGCVSVPQGNVIALVSILSISVASSLQGAVATESIFITVWFLIMISTIFTGIVSLTMGYLKIGDLIRYVPYPVIGGYFAGLALLFYKSSFPLMSDINLTLSNLTLLLQPNIIILWLPGLVFGLALLLMNQYIKHFLTTPILLATSILIFYSIFLLRGISISDAQVLGLLLPPLPDGTLFPEFSMLNFSDIEFNELLPLTGTILSIAVMGILCTLIATSGIEIVFRKEFNLNTELKISGIGNILSGLLGGVPSHHSAGDSQVAYELNARHGLVAIFQALFLLLSMFFAQSILLIIPKFVLGGMLLFIANVFVKKWFIQSFFKLNKIDYSIILIISAIVLFQGFLTAIFAGILISAIIFVVQYAKINIIRLHTNTTALRSKVDRDPLSKDILEKHGEKIEILLLEGYLFFGTSNQLLKYVRKIVENKKTPPEFIVLDLKSVSSTDSSAEYSFERLFQIAEKFNFTICLSNMSNQLEKRFLAMDLENNPVKLFNKLDFALEWCEKKLVEEYFTQEDQAHKKIEDLLLSIFDTTQESTKFLSRMKKQTLSSNSYLFKQNDPADKIFFIENGEIEILLEKNNEKPLRLRLMTKGSSIGEIGLYTKNTRSASARATKDCVLYYFTADDFENLQLKEPNLTAKIHAYVIKQLSRQIRQNDLLLKSIE